MQGRRNEYQVATAALKRALKKQGMTYLELGRAIAMSESGIKKLFSAKDGSFQRLAQICATLGLTMAELFEGDDETMFELAYSEKQQQFLVDEPKALLLYWRLVYERLALVEAERLTGLTSKEGFALLRKMDQLQLLDLLPGGRVRVPAVRQIRWVGDGPLIRKLYRDWSQRFIESVAGPEPGPEKLFLIRYMKVSAKTRRDLIEALRDLEKEFVRRGIREMRSEAPELEHLRWVFAVDDRSFLS